MHSRHGALQWLTGWIRALFAVPAFGQPDRPPEVDSRSPRPAGSSRGTRPKGREQLTEAAQVLEETRASARQRRQAKAEIRRACNEGRLPRKACDARVQSAAWAVTTQELHKLVSDLGTREGAHPVRTAALLYTLVVLVAVWLPVLSDRRWLFLAVPLTIISAFGIWVLPELLTGDSPRSTSTRVFRVPRPGR
jgi:Domain of unknown function (DUF1707)